MAIDLTEYNSLIDGLMTKTKSYVLTEYTAGRIKDTEYGKIISESIGAIMANAGAMLESYYKAEITKDSKTYQVAIFEEQVNNLIKDVDVKERSTIIQETQSAKDLLVKSQQIISMTKEDNVKIAQESFVTQQKLSEEQNTILIENNADLALNQSLQAVATTKLINQKYTGRQH